MEWPAMQWVREVMSVLSESGFKDIPSWLHEEFMGFGMSHNTTLLAENLINLANRQKKKAHTGKVTAKGLWHSMALGSVTCREFGRPNVPITNAARAASACTIPETMFDRGSSPGTLKSEDLDRLQLKKPDWANHGPENHRLASVASMACDHFNGNWNNLKMLWLSLLAVKNTLMQTPDGRLLLVVAATRYGAIVRRVPGMMKKNNVFSLTMAAPEIQCNDVEFVMDPKEYSVVELFFFSAKYSFHAVPFESPAKS